MTNRTRRLWCCRPAVERIEDRTVPTAFTTTSPTSGGALPDYISAVGGIVLDLIGSNGSRVVSQLAPASLFRGMFNDGQPAGFRGNPGTIGVQAGFTPALLDSLGPGLVEVAVRLTLFDGDTAAGDFDFHENRLLLNGLDLGDFSDVATEEVSPDGLTSLSSNAPGGFRNDTLDTGFFSSTNPTLLAGLRAALLGSGTAVYQLEDVDPFDNFFDFTQGLSGGPVSADRPPTVVNEPPPTPAATPPQPAFEPLPVPAPAAPQPPTPAPVSLVLLGVPTNPSVLRAQPENAVAAPPSPAATPTVPVSSAPAGP